MATHVVQFVFLGHSGFKFPFAHFPSQTITPSALFVNFWKAVRFLRSGGFSLDYCCTDGGENNRQFIKMHFKGKDPIEERFTIINPYTRKPLVFYLDPSVSKLFNYSQSYHQHSLNINASATISQASVD